jgi:hypothetical protein
MKKIILLLICLISFPIHSQNTKFEYGIYNIGLGGFVGGFGALINKSTFSLN